VGHILWQEEGTVLFSFCWASRAQPFSGLIPMGLMSILCLYFWDCPNLEGQVPVCIFPRNKVAQSYLQALWSRSYFTTDGQTVRMSWFRAHSGTCEQILLPFGRFLSESCYPVSMGRPLWREDGSAEPVTRLAQPGGPVSRISIPQKQRGPVILPGNRFPLRDSQGYGASILNRLHTRRALCHYEPFVHNSEADQIENIVRPTLLTARILATGTAPLLYVLGVEQQETPPMPTHYYRNATCHLATGVHHGIMISALGRHVTVYITEELAAFTLHQ
jgi:hypothetical protein